MYVFQCCTLKHTWFLLLLLNSAVTTYVGQTALAVVWVDKYTVIHCTRSTTVLAKRKEVGRTSHC
jgi:hypothetical protein